ncbi:hypothetical protein [Bifidobacterium simiarum]|uniref:hypothetical protein n=1 Tax=Bifidobacterium simiarum TaxID=2045441 RepID=UPI001BDCA4B4|nr:hypothetical protein [Bifidobacterium simiarum]MBT1166796.1 hypothetical protein [Bifidobacterium simiarum]
MTRTVESQAPVLTAGGLDRPGECRSVPIRDLENERERRSSNRLFAMVADIVRLIGPGMIDGSRGILVCRGSATDSFGPIVAEPWFPHAGASLESGGVGGETASVLVDRVSGEPCGLARAWMDDGIRYQAALGPRPYRIMPDLTVLLQDGDWDRMSRLWRDLTGRTMPDMLFIDLTGERPAVVPAGLPTAAGLRERANGGDLPLIGSIRVREVPAGHAIPALAPVPAGKEAASASVGRRPRPLTGIGDGPIGQRDTFGRLLLLCLGRILYATAMLNGGVTAYLGLHAIFSTVGPLTDAVTAASMRSVLTGTVILLGAVFLAMGCARWDEWIHDPLQHDLK